MLAAEVGGKASAVKVDASDFKSLVQLMTGAEVVVSTVGPYYRFGEQVVKAAIAAKTSVVDICDDGDATEKILALDGEAKKAGITAIVGMGCTPGITNLMAKRGADKMDRVDEIDTSWGWTSIDPKMTGSAIIDHYFHAVTGEIITFRDGKWTKIPALSNPKLIEFISPIGCLELPEVGHPEPVTLPRYIKGVKNVTNRGGVWPKEFNEVAGIFNKLGLTEIKEMDLKGSKVKARDIATAIVLALPVLAEDFAQSLVDETLRLYGEFGIEGVVLRVDVRGEKGGKPFQYSYGAGSNADLLTALPSVLAALMFCRGQIKGAGVFAPEGIVNTDIFFKELVPDIPVTEIVEGPISL
jgi:saccharopine dehydrogenase-like NADP-dependent oxidoreductase